MSTFEPMFSIQVRHDYSDGPPPVSLELDAEAETLASRGNMQTRATPGRLDVYAESDREDLEALAENGELEFIFRIRADNTILPTVTSGLISRDPMIFVVEDGSVLRKSETLSRDFLKPLQENGVIKVSDLLRPPIAIIKLSISPLTKNETFIVHFEATENFWMYHLVGGEKDTAYSINDPDDTHSFESVEPRQLANGQIAERFRSTAPIAMRAHPTQRFELLGDGPFGKRVILPVLPAAAPGSSSLDPAGNGLISDIYVNVT